MPLGTVAAGNRSALTRGFAVASTDTGHQSKGGGFDAGFMQDQQAALDFAYVAVGRVAALKANHRTITTANRPIVPILPDALSPVVAREC